LEEFRVATISLPSDQVTPITPGLQITRDPVFGSFFDMRLQLDRLQQDRTRLQAIVDEFGAGDVWLTVRNSYFNRNFDDGLDVDENESGSLYVDLDGIFAKSNRDQGVTLDETKIGDVEATISNSTIVNNDVSEGYDIKAVQNNSGGGTLMLDNVVTDDWWLSGVVLTLVP